MLREPGHAWRSNTFDIWKRKQRKRSDGEEAFGRCCVAIGNASLVEVGMCMGAALLVAFLTLSWLIPEGPEGHALEGPEGHARD